MCLKSFALVRPPRAALSLIQHALPPRPKKAEIIRLFSRKRQGNSQPKNITLIAYLLTTLLSAIENLLGLFSATKLSIDVLRKQFRKFLRKKDTSGPVIFASYQWFISVFTLISKNITRFDHSKMFVFDHILPSYVVISDFRLLSVSYQCNIPLSSFAAIFSSPKF